VATARERSLSRRVGNPTLLELKLLGLKFPGLKLLGLKFPELKTGVVTHLRRKAVRWKLRAPKCAIVIHRVPSRQPPFPCRFPEQLRYRRHNGSLKFDGRRYSEAAGLPPVPSIPARPASAVRIAANSRTMRSHHSRLRGSRLPINSVASRTSAAGGGNETATTHEQPEI
jgi:hypothetical protein